MIEQLPSLDGLSERQKDTLIQVLWGEVQALKAQVAELDANLPGPKKGSREVSFQFGMGNYNDILMEQLA